MINPGLFPTVVPVVSPQDANGATAAQNTGNALVSSGGGVDCAGASHATFVFQTGNIAAAMSAFKLQESDSANMSGAADITNAAATIGTSDDNKAVVISVTLGGDRKRYIEPILTGGSGATLISCVALLWGLDSPRTASDMGTHARVVV